MVGAKHFLFDGKAASDEWLGFASTLLLHIYKLPRLFKSLTGVRMVRAERLEQCTGRSNRSWAEREGSSIHCECGRSRFPC
jgi:hypothetical protein